ncbi:TetR/AcrR family transcriptional regulator C-terminal domain-containing protein [Streptomyces armeniacus]|uniref:TetR/AcrR family transcriptional regulator C-terminal domain-containing protein n=1 Tax=Streptomyces armeniacus TaxID=83291 RepID=UPI001FE59819|nr:TetR/AcrR family transcriptional regulator C-terminal domain-containing protein [Streptomyces armeniacus]
MDDEKKTGKRGKAAPARRPPLDRAHVVDTALRLLNEVGLEGLTLRRIAKELDVQAPALYWHFTGKQALLDEMATAMFRTVAASAPSEEDVGADGTGWQQRLTGMQRALRRGLLAYRDGAKVFGGTRFTDFGHAALQESYLRTLVAAGFTPSAAARALSLAFAFTLGFVTEEQGVYPVPGERREGYDVAARAERIGAEHPLAAQAGGDLFLNYEERFEEGLEVLVAGIEAKLLPKR